MASCQKCGRGKIKKRNGHKKCKRCGFLGAERDLSISDAVNPFGSCFDAAAHNLLGNYNSGVGNMMMCHGVGISNHPDSMAQPISHAWVEFDHPEGRAAFDPIFLLAQPAELYRRNFKAEYVVEYTKEEFMRLWKEDDYPGPWDERIKQLTTEGKREAA